MPGASMALLALAAYGDIQINPLDQYQIFQADMSMKF